MKILHYIKRKWICKFIIAASLAAIVSMYSFSYQTTSYAVTFLSLNYENAAKGLYPNNTRFNMYDVISEDLVEKVIDRAGIAGEISVWELLDSLSIAPRFTRSTAEQYIGTEFTLVLRLEQPLKHVSAENILMLLCEAYYEDFTNRFAVNSFIEDFAMGDTEDYDYNEISQLITTRVSHVRDYITRRRHENGSFRSQITNETFASLGKRLDNFTSVLYDRYTSYIVETGVTKDYDRYVTETNYRNSLLIDNYDRLFLQHTMRLAAIDIYDPEQTAVAMIPTYDTSHEFYMSKTRIGMDYIATDSNRYLNEANEVKLQILANNLKLERLAEAITKGAANPAVRAKADEMIFNMNKELDEIIDILLYTDSDYINYSLSKALAFHPRGKSTTELYDIKTALFVFVLVFIAFSTLQQVLDNYYKKRAARLAIVNVQKQEGGR